MLITKEKILKDSKFKSNLIASLIFIIVGILIWFAPFTVQNLDKMNFIATIIILSLTFVLWFEVLGLVLLIKAIKLRGNIKKRKFYILSDTIVGKTVSRNSRTQDGDDYCRLKLKNFDKNVFVTATQYRKVKEEQKCTLVFIKNKKEPSFIYPGNDYTIDESLKENIVSIDQILSDKDLI